MMMRDDTESVAELELLRAQRAQLASRLKTPWWYVAGCTVAWALACATPIGSHYFRGAGYGGGLLAIVILLLLQQALVRVSGLNVGFGTSQFPSGRPWAIALAVVILANSALEGLLLEHHLLAAAIMVAVLATFAGVSCWQGHLRAIRRDLAAGTVTRRAG
jgi:hypothetical protein